MGDGSGGAWAKGLSTFSSGPVNLEKCPFKVQKVMQLTKAPDL